MERWQSLVYSDSLENYWGLKTPVSSNLTLSATMQEENKPIVESAKKEESKKQCCCDFTAYCPIHSVDGKPAYKFDKDSYIAN